MTLKRISLRRWWRQDGERGAGGISLSWLMLLPVLLLLVFGGIQIGIQFYADGLIQAAAQAGARAAASAPVSEERGRAAAQQFLDEKATGTVTGGQITIASDGTQVTVTITAKPQTILAGIGGPTTRSASVQLQPDLIDGGA